MLAAPVQFLHALERLPERAPSVDATGIIGFDAQGVLLQALGALGHRRGQIAQEAGRRMLVAAGARAEAVGLGSVDTMMCHGALMETALEPEPQAKLLKLGDRPPSDARPHLDHQPGAARTQRAHAGTRGSKSGLRRSAARVDCIRRQRDGAQAGRPGGRQPDAGGMPVMLAMAGSTASREALDQAELTLCSGGFSVTSELLDGEPEAALPARTREEGTLLMIGVYGHPRIGRLIVGSTTTALLRATCQVPVLVLR